MKTIIAVTGIVVVMGLAVYYKDSTPLPEYVKEQVTLEVTNSPEIPASWQTDEDAIKAAKAVVRKKELEAESARLTEEIETLEANIVQLQEKKKAVDKESGAY